MRADAREVILNSSSFGSSLSRAIFFITAPSAQFCSGWRVLTLADLGVLQVGDGHLVSVLLNGGEQVRVVAHVLVDISQGSMGAALELTAAEGTPLPRNAR